MKKYIVSSIVIVSFIAYSFYQRVLGIPSASVISTSNSSSKLSQNSPTITPTPTLVPTDTPTTIQSGKTQTIPTVTPIPTATPTSPPAVASGYKDGTYTGDPADAFYGNIQVQATISGGKITNVQFLQAPNDRGESIQINQQADPILAQEAIQAQNANVDVVSGATDSSQAFVQSLQSALDQAKS
jgi:uncharacterized protein with FMN-binding domain